MARKNIAVGAIYETLSQRDVQIAADKIQQLPENGINLEKVTRQPEDEGIEKFNKLFDTLMATSAKPSPRQVREVP